MIIKESQKQHLWQAHKVKAKEVYESVLIDVKRKIYRAPETIESKKGYLYFIFGQTLSGRCLITLLRIFEDGNAYVISSREMNAKEKRKYYGR
ncbi:hypothetical protein [Athalassotoga sp.]|uniref:hypothetical protein n=1 Tax=Athalassotoga sp. TaxID=2022597 RepID=UPI003D0523B6